IALLEIAPPAWIERRREADDLLDGHVVVKRFVLVYKAGTRPAADARCGIVARKAEHARLTGGGASHAEEELDRGRLAGPVAAEESEDGSLRHAEVQPAQRIDRIEALSQIHRFDRQRLRPPVLLPWSVRRVLLRTTAGSLRRSARVRAAAGSRQRRWAAPSASCRWPSCSWPPDPRRRRRRHV